MVMGLRTECGDLTYVAGKEGLGGTWGEGEGPGKVSLAYPRAGPGLGPSEM